MYRLATVHCITDGWIDIPVRQYRANSWLYCMASRID